MTNEIVLGVQNPVIPEGDYLEQHFFPNGYGISIIRNRWSYGNRQGLFEAAHIVGSVDNWEFAENPRGWLSVSDVVAFAREIAQLPAVTSELETQSVQELE